MKTPLLTILIVLFLASLACNAVPLAVGGDPTEQPTSVLFQDDFSDPSSGWDVVTVSDGETNYANGVYRIFVNTTRTDIWANPGLSFTDVRVEVDATKVGGPDDNDFGVICRSMSASQFYFFYISSDGYYAIGKLKDGEQELIGMESLQPSESINQGDAANHIRADCIGDRLALYVNGEKIAEVQDSEYTSGDVGLIAGSYDTPGVDIHFDNFMVLRPDPLPATPIPASPTP